MSLSVKTIMVGEKAFTLRLTSKALMNFNLKHGQESASPVVAVLDATSNLAARIDLLTNALNHPENKNTVKNGGDLLDLMADSGSWEPEAINNLILELAHESGLLGEEDFLALIEPVAQNGKKMISTLSDLLLGKPVGSTQELSQKDVEENPT